MQRVRRERLIAQIRSDQNRDFAFCAATEQAQVEQDDSPSRNKCNGMRERETGNIQRKDGRISPQRSKRGSPHQRRVPSGWGKGLDHDNNHQTHIK